MNLPTRPFFLLAAALVLLCSSLAPGWAAETKAGIEAKLKALEAARGAGVLTQDEYAAKKAGLEARLAALKPPLDEATRKKLAALEAAREAGVLTDAEYERKKAQLTAHGPAGADPSRAKGNTYRHALGYTLWYPDGWTLREGADGLQLFPPDAKVGPSGPTELYFVGAEAAKGVTRPDDPRVIQHYDALVRRLFPFLIRAGKPEPLRASVTPGVLMRWQGTSPQGKAVRARIYVTLIRGFAVGIAAVAEKGALEARDAALGRMFASIGLGAGKRDPRLAGAWRQTRYVRQRGSNTTIITDMVLRPDGKFVIGGRLLGSGVDSKDPGKRGRWGTGGGKLHLLWDDRSYAVKAYRVEGPRGRQSMILTPEGGKGELWSQIR